MKTLATALAAPLLLAAPLTAEPFAFVALGDTTYAVPGDYPLYRELIEVVNAAQPAFSIHVGDTKGYGDCGREFQETQRDFFDSYTHPVFYTPGNNEWADCWKDNRGNADPTEILALMREVFDADSQSRGKLRMPLVRQADVDTSHAEFAENLRWSHGGVTFATLHMVGTHNNMELRTEKYWREFQRRETANAAWVTAVFEAAREAGHKAVVLAFHSNPFDETLRYPGGPFEPVLQEILRQTDTFEGQVLIVQGHYHEFTIDRPLTELDLETPAVRHPNLTRLQVYGWPDMKAVRVTVDTDKPWVFGFEPLYGEHSVSTTSDD